MEECGGGRRRGKEEVGRSGGGPIPEERSEEVPKGRRHSMFVNFSSTHVDVRFFVDFRRRLIFDIFSVIFVYGRCSSIFLRFSSTFDFRTFFVDLRRRSIFRRFSLLFPRFSLIFDVS